MSSVHSELDRRAQVESQLRQVMDPELGMDIVRLGLVYGIRVLGELVEVDVTMTTPGCPLQHAISSGIRSVIAELPWVSEVRVSVVWDPPWHPGLIEGLPEQN
ncbi:MAG TPA: metal-sulfur cluster assembly factor [Gemmatimonadales bacterium]|nr:metal-sulfur cluster assembly factor [Gemmatimonadales bacterium]